MIRGLHAESERDNYRVSLCQSERRQRSEQIAPRITDACRGWALGAGHPWPQRGGADSYLLVLFKNRMNCIVFKVTM